MDVVLTVPTSRDRVNILSPDPLDAFHVSSSCSPPSISPECHHMSIINYRDMLEGNMFDGV